MTTETKNSQDFREELLELHNHKTLISGYRGERSCHRKPVRFNAKRVGLKLRQTKNGGSKAFFSQTQRSTSFSCPLAHQKARASKEADMAYLTAQHFKVGRTILSGTLGLKHQAEFAPRRFYNPKESFRFSDEWEAITSSQGKLGSLHKYVREQEYLDFLENNDSTASFADWDLTRRLDTVNSSIAHTFNARDFRRICSRVGITAIGHTIATEIEVKPAQARSGAFPDYWGRSSNNVHIHFLIFLEDSKVTPRQIRMLREELQSRWASNAKKAGFVSLLAGSSLKAVTPKASDFARAGKYITKGTTFRDDPARLGSSYWDALRQSALGDFRATIWWQNFEGAVRGRHFFRISQGLMNRYELKAERERRLEAWKSSQSETSVVAFFDRKDWYLTTSTTPRVREDLLKIAEIAGLEGCREWLQLEGIRYHLSEAEDVSESQVKLIVAERLARTV